MAPAIARPTVRGGLFTRRIIIEQATASTDADTASDDSSGDVSDADAGITWSAFCNAWASIDPTSVVGGLQQGEVQWTVQMPFQAGITNGMRVNEPSTGIVLDILAVLNIHEASTTLTLECVSRRYPPV